MRLYGETVITAEQLLEGWLAAEISIIYERSGTIREDIWDTYWEFHALATSMGLKPPRLPGDMQPEKWDMASADEVEAAGADPGLRDVG